MLDFNALSEVTFVGLTGVVVIGGWVAIAFWRSHRAFNAREFLYQSLCESIERGEKVSPSQYKDLSSEDRAALQALQKSKQTMTAARRREVAAEALVT